MKGEVIILKEGMPMVLVAAVLLFVKLIFPDVRLTRVIGILLRSVVRLAIAALILLLLLSILIFRILL